LALSTYFPPWRNVGKVANSFFTSALDGGGGIQRHPLPPFTTGDGTYGDGVCWIEGCGPKTWRQMKHFSLCQWLNPGRPVRIQSLHRHLGGVVVIVLATGPTGRGFKPGRDDGCLRAIKIRSTPSSRMGSKSGRSHVIRFYGILKIPWGISDTDRQNSHSFVHSSYLPQMSLQVGQRKSSGGRIRSYPQPASSHSSPCSHITRGINNRPVGGRSSET
jgi:hypothetical protein